MILNLSYLLWVFILRNHLLFYGLACMIVLLHHMNPHSIISIRSISLFWLKQIQDLMGIPGRNLLSLNLQRNPYKMLSCIEDHIWPFNDSQAIDIQHKQIPYLQFCRILTVRNLAYWHILHQSIHFYCTYQTVYLPNPQDLMIFLSWSN